MSLCKNSEILVFKFPTEPSEVFELAGDSILCYVPKLSLLPRLFLAGACLISLQFPCSHTYFFYIPFVLFSLEAFCSNLDCL